MTIQSRVKNAADFTATYADEIQALRRITERMIREYGNS